MTFSNSRLAIEVPEGSLAVFWSAIGLEVRISDPEARCYRATVAVRKFLEMNLPDDLTRALFEGQLGWTCELRDRACDNVLFAQWESNLRQNRVGFEHIVLLEMQARLSRLFPKAKSSGGVVHLYAKKTGPSVGCFTRVVKMVGFVARNYARPLAIQQIASRAGSRTDHAVHLFRQVVGMSMIAFVNRLRVLHAQRLLLITDLSIAEIVAKSGFTSASRFNAAFRQVSRCSAREYRLRHFALQPRCDRFRVSHTRNAHEGFSTYLGNAPQTLLNNRLRSFS